MDNTWLIILLSLAFSNPVICDIKFTNNYRKYDKYYVYGDDISV